MAKNTRDTIVEVGEYHDPKWHAFQEQPITLPEHRPKSSTGASWSVIFLLAFQSIGIVYGDIGTSPLYVFASTFPNGINNTDDILGVLSLILYTITLIPLIKYVCIVLHANDNGNGGTFALYSLLCRYAKVSLTPSPQDENRDEELHSKHQRRSSKLQLKLESSKFAKVFLLFLTILGTSMVIGDGVLTPCISVLSAVGGIKQATSAMTDDMVVWISAGILVCLFSVQRFGTDKVGYVFAPIICIWLSFIGGIGVYNFFKYDSTVLKALNPYYIVDYFKRNKRDAWISLGGIVLSVTGTEALFADVGHFTVQSIQISMCLMTYPALVLAYTGQASFLREHQDLVSNTFYESIPKPLYWLMFGIAVMAAIIASQAMISGTFSIVHQSLSLECFPRVKIVHTSTKYEGQIYIPEINNLLMLACVGLTLGFKSTMKIGNAYGIAVVFVMTLTSAFMVLIMIVIWKTHILFIILYVLTIGSMELMYLSSVLYKFDKGGYLPVIFAASLMLVMFVWNEVHRRKYYYELNHKFSLEKLKELALDGSVCRVPGLAMFYSELVEGIPPIFNHYVENVSAVHSVLVFISIKSVPISKVPMGERFLFHRLEPRDLNLFQCVARYGYTDVRNKNELFESLVVEKLKEFIIRDYDGNKNGNEKKEIQLIPDDAENQKNQQDNVLKTQIGAIDKAWHMGVVHIIGENDMTAAEGSGMVNKILINYAYNFLKRNVRRSEEIFDIPRKRMFKVLMTCEL